MSAPEDGFTADFAQELGKKLDTAMIGIIEEVEGRVPTNAEIMEHCKRLIHPDGEWEYKWRGRTILHVLFQAPGEATIIDHRLIEGFDGRDTVT